MRRHDLDPGIREVVTPLTDEGERVGSREDAAEKAGLRFRGPVQANDERHGKHLIMVLPDDRRPRTIVHSAFPLNDGWGMPAVRPSQPL